MNGLKIQWVLRTATNLTEVPFPISFSSTQYFAIGTVWANDTGMTDTAYQAQCMPKSYYINKVVFGGSTSVRRNVFAIGY